MSEHWSDELNDFQEEDIYGESYWLVSNEWFNEQVVEPTGRYENAPTEGTAYPMDIDSMPVVSLDTDKPSEEIEMIKFHEEAHIFVDSYDLDDISSESIAIARENWYRKQRGMDPVDVFSRELSESFFWDVVGVDQVEEWTEAYETAASEHDDEYALRSAKKATEKETDLVDRFMLPFRNPYIEDFRDIAGIE